MCFNVLIFHNFFHCSACAFDVFIKLLTYLFIYYCYFATLSGCASCLQSLQRILWKLLEFFTGVISDGQGQISLFKHRKVVGSTQNLLNFLSTLLWLGNNTAYVLFDKVKWQY